MNKHQKSLNSEFEFILTIKELKTIKIAREQVIGPSA